MSNVPTGRKATAQPARLSSSIPSLPSLESPFPLCARPDAANMLRLLRQIAIKARQKQPRPFYSIRTVARRFDVPLTTVARVYARLKKEGILGSVWGSSTIVEPSELNRELRIRGIVAVPTCLKAFCALRNYRSLFENIHAALWKRGFATRPLFYENDAVAQRAFGETLLNEKVDVVLWLLPSPAQLAGTKRLLDRGVRVVSVVDSLIADRRADYLLSRLHALKEVLNLWKLKGIRFVTIVHKSDSESTANLGALEMCLDEARMGHTLVTVSPSPRGQALSLCRQANLGIIFPACEAALQLAFEYPRDFALLVKHYPMLMMEGMPGLPNHIPQMAGIEAIEFDWRPVVNRLTGDLLKWKPHSEEGKPIVFHARRLQQCSERYAAVA